MTNFDGLMELALQLGRRDSVIVAWQQMSPVTLDVVRELDDAYDERAKVQREFDELTRGMHLTHAQRNQLQTMWLCGLAMTLTCIHDAFVRQGKTAVFSGSGRTGSSIDFTVQTNKIHAEVLRATERLRRSLHV